MSGVALALVLAAALIHATWNRMLHGATDRLAAAMRSVLLAPDSCSGDRKSVV